ncbi:M50 family metallopeptidase [Cellulosimicrobium sp. PMB13]|uniref:M50 family metallopeptidase n=1 Tax=Cellulosimicrobium sp. PMB13 TaxID=3120158 RepID=UPI003F4C4C7D
MRTTELLDATPRLRPGLLVSRALTRGASTMYVVKDRANGRAFEVPEKEHFVLTRLDGVRTLGDIGDEYAATYGRRLGEPHWERLLWLLGTRSLLDTGSPQAQDPPSTPTRALAMLDAMAAAAGAVVNRRVLAGALALLGITFVAVLVDLPRLLPTARDVLDHPEQVVAVVVLLWVSEAAHELAHGVVARHYGCTVTKVNVALLRCVVEDYLYLPSRGAQVLIAAAGVIVNAAFLVPFAVVWFVAPGSPFVAAFLVGGAALTVLSLLPLPPWDGYKIVVHALGSVSLATESQRYVYGIGRRIRRPELRYPRAAAVHLASYAVVWFALVALVITGVVVGAGGLLSRAMGPAGQGIVIAVVVLVVAGWLAQPALNKNKRSTS